MYKIRGVRVYSCGADGSAEPPMCIHVYLPDERSSSTVHFTNWVLILALVIGVTCVNLGFEISYWMFVPIFVDTTAPSTKVNENGFYKNSTNIPLTWKEISDDGDLEGYYLYYQIKDGSSLGDWVLYGYYDTILTTNFTAENGKIYRFRTIGIDVYGNKEIKGTYDTEVKIDMDLPRSELWLSEGDIQYTNLDGVTVNWKENGTSDIQGYLIE